MNYEADRAKISTNGTKFKESVIKTLSPEWCVLCRGSEECMIAPHANAVNCFDT